MTTTSTTAINWVSSTARSFSVPRSYYSFNQDVQSDQRLITTNAIALGATPPSLYFRHRYSTEGTGQARTGDQHRRRVISGRMPARTLSREAIQARWMPLPLLTPDARHGRGSSNGEFMRTEVNLAPYANQIIKVQVPFHFRCGYQS